MIEHETGNVKAYYSFLEIFEKYDFRNWYTKLYFTVF